MFAKELRMYVDFLEQSLAPHLLANADLKHLNKYRSNLLRGIQYCQELAGQQPFEGENLASLASEVTRQKQRLDSLWAKSGLSE